MTESKPNNADQLESHAYRLAALDSDFLLADQQRGIRFLLEYEKAEQALKAWGVESTVVVFGSARVKEDGPGKHAAWYAKAREFANIVSLRGGARDRDVVTDTRMNVIATGGGGGIMEAANRGAHDAGAPSVGFNIRLPFEQEPNSYSTPDLTFQFHYFAMRKMHLAMRARALVIFPGGFGTLDECFELLTLAQTGKAPTIPVVLFDEKFWKKAINLPYLVEQGTISAADLNLFKFAEEPEQAWDILLKAGILERRKE